MWYYFHTYHRKHLWQWLYPYIAWHSKAIHVRILDLRVHHLRGNNQEHNMTKHLLNTNLSSWKKKRPSHWVYQLLFIPQNQFTHWFDIEVMEIMNKICTICEVAIYTSLQPFIYQFMILHKNPRSYTPWNFSCSIEGIIHTTQERYWTLNRPKPLISGNM